LGNSFGDLPNHIQNWVGGAFVGQDGTVYANGYNDDGHHGTSAFQNGAFRSAANYQYPEHGGLSITSTPSYTFFGAQVDASLDGQTGYPPPGSFWVGFHRVVGGRDNLGMNAPFIGVAFDPSFLPVETPPASLLPFGLGTDPTIADITGLAAVDDPGQPPTNQGTLYVSDPWGGTGHHGALKKYRYTPNNITPSEFVPGSFSNTIDFPNPGQMVIGQNGVLYVVKNNASISKVTPDGVVINTFAFGTGARPYGLAYDSANNHLLVTDLGPAGLNIEVVDLNNNPPTLFTTYGDPGGAFQGSGATVGTVNYSSLGAARFVGPEGVGVYTSDAGQPSIAVVDADQGQGNPPTGGPAGVALVSYNLASGAPNWSLYGGLAQEAAFDPGDPNTVYSSDKAFTMNYNNTTPGTEWSFKGVTERLATYTGDPRNGVGPEGLWLRRLSGNLVEYEADFAGDLDIFRTSSASEDQGQVFIPSVQITQDSIYKYDTMRNQFMFQQSLSDGYNAGAVPTVDQQGNVYLVYWGHHYFRKIDFQGLDGNNPLYYYRGPQDYFTAPAPFSSGPEGPTGLARVWYAPNTADPNAGELWISGFTVDHPSTENGGSMGAQDAGTVLCKYYWNGTSDPSMLLPVAPPILLPYIDPQNSVAARSVAVEGDYVFVSQGSDGDGSAPAGVINVYSRSDLHFVRSFTLRSAQNSGNILDGREPIRVGRLGDGTYLVLAEGDNSDNAGILRWNPQAIG
jgi:hypothetical protein